ncbi:Hypothetical_protein [Hexamita inflata]|uniref:Hypothetical_protein n=1 Tax=Hexamita inflata TaxID=28002 RepID=A0AA86NY60_9EUKA|nr:Hypothetical protein HINF_LOCUS14529 [Hexamita inflata]
MFKKDRYCCLFSWIYVMFASILCTGMILGIIIGPEEIEYPIYYMSQNGTLEHSYDTITTSQNVGLCVTLSIIGFFGIAITICVHQILKKNGTSELEPLIRKEVPTVSVQFPQVNYQYQPHQVNQVVVPRMM